MVDRNLTKEISANVKLALREDVGTGDLTGELIDAATVAGAVIMTRESMTLAGRPWVDEVCRQVDPGICIDWQAADGDVVAAGAVLCKLHGPARSILTAERTALNFLQLLSATATAAAACVAAVADTRCRILDTRKTIPGLRLAQKYAVRCGGAVNHRIGLFDAILIKENHIASAGGLSAAIAAARKLHAGMPVEVEVETLDQLREALSAGAERLLLDNFPIERLERAVVINRRDGKPPAELEASGGVTLPKLAAIAATGVDYISIGAMTKNVAAVDLTLRFK